MKYPPSRWTRFTGASLSGCPTAIRSLEFRIVTRAENEDDPLARSCRRADFTSLKEQGYEVHILKDRVWTDLSDRIKIMCIADYFQDAILLVDLNGRLLVNKNDANDRGWKRFVKRIIKQYHVSFLLSLSGFGDADMINFVDEAGTRILPYAARKYPVGRAIAAASEDF